MDNLRLLDIIQRLALFFVGCSLGVYIERTGKSPGEIMVLQFAVYTVLIILYFVAKAAVE